MDRLKEIRICLGSGGVGKTSVSAAFALKSALEGRKALVLTVDPARRLRSALGLDKLEGQSRVPLETGAGKGELWAAVMDVRATLDRAVEQYADPAQARTVLAHPIYQVLITSLSGMQELIAFERLDQAISEGFETIVVDTAPGRHALEFLDKPEFFIELLSFPVVRLVGRTYHLWEALPFFKLSRRTLEIYARVESLLGAQLVRQVLDFYSVFRTIAEGFARRAKKNASLLRDPGLCSFSIVTTPARASRDTRYFWSELQKRRFPVRNLLVNRVWPQFETDPPKALAGVFRETVDWYRDISRQHRQICQSVRREYEAEIPSFAVIPELPQDIGGLASLQKIARFLT